MYQNDQKVWGKNGPGHCKGTWNTHEKSPNTLQNAKSDWIRFYEQVMASSLKDSNFGLASSWLGVTTDSRVDIWFNFTIH